MPVDIWSKCDGANQVTLLNETAWRLIETQEQTATRKLVDSFAEQAILEDMIESSKPFIIKEHLSYHPLLYTPFRYPPLKYGSRFSKKTEPSLWYGALELNTVMAEKAFYQFNFIRASEAEYDMVEQTLTAFSARIKTAKGVHLFSPPFADYTQFISSQNSYEVSQKLGAAMREAGIQAFAYKSARDVNDGMNVALFTPQAFLHKKPDTASFQSWLCVSTNELVEFIRTNSISSAKNIFSLKQFTLNDVLPFPPS